MTFPRTAAIFAAVATSALASGSAFAQYGDAPQSPPSAPTPSPNAAPQANAPERQIDISKGAQKAMLALQEAVKANDAASIPARIAEAQAVAKTPQDRYYIGVLQLRAGIAAKDNAAIAAGIEAMLASGGAQPSEHPALYLDLAKTYVRLAQHDKAAPALERAIQLNPNDLQPVVLLAETRNSQGRTTEAVSLIQKAIAMSSAANQKAKEDWYKRAVALSYNAEQPAAVAASRDWVQAYPSPNNWSDALRIYRRFHSPDEAVVVDMFRLARAAKALRGDGDYYEYAELVARKGMPGEAKAVLEEGFTAGQIDRNKPMFRELMTSVTTRAAGDRDTLEGSATKARAGTNAQPAIATGDAYFGYGEYAKAAELYRVALGKAGADPNLVNLRLGMALVRAGDKAGARAALNAVTGPRAELAKFWLAFLATSA